MVQLLLHCVLILQNVKGMQLGRSLLDIFAFFHVTFLEDLLFVVFISFSCSTFLEGFLLYIYISLFLSVVVSFSLL